MHKIILASAIALCLPTTSYADTLGFKFGADLWQQSYEGTIKSGFAGSQIDLENDLGFDSETGANVYFVLEHPIPIIPNVKIQHTELDISETNTLQRNITFDGVTYNVNADIKSVSDLTHTDFTLYYEVLDNWFSLDLGITARVFNEGIKITNQTNGDSASEELDETLPMLYGAVKFDLPLTGLYVGGDINWLAVSGDSLVDSKINLGYESSFGLGIEAGYRRFDLEIKDDDDSADITIEGAYAGLFYHF